MRSPRQFKVCCIAIGIGIIIGFQPLIGPGAAAAPQPRPRAGTPCARLLQQLAAPGLEADRRAELALALGRTGNPAALVPLVRLSRDPAAAVRRAAAQALGRLRDPRAVPALRRLVDRDQDHAVVRRAVRSLTAFPGWPVCSFLMDVATDTARPGWLRVAAREITRREAAGACTEALRRHRREMRRRSEAIDRALEGDLSAPTSRKVAALRSTRRAKMALGFTTVSVGATGAGLAVVSLGVALSSGWLYDRPAWGQRRLEVARGMLIAGGIMAGAALAIGLPAYLWAYGREKRLLGELSSGAVPLVSLSAGDKGARVAMRWRF